MNLLEERNDPPPNDIRPKPIAKKRRKLSIDIVQLYQYISTMTMKAAFFINSNSGEPIYQQLTRQLKHAISTGSLKPGDRLPTVRELAEALVINPNTVARGYRELIAEGLLEGTQGSGTFVTAALPRVKPQERARRLQPFVDQLISEAALLGIEGYDLMKLVQERVHVREEGTHDNDKRAHEKLR